MSFAAPLAFALGALSLPVIVLYILKVKRRRVRVPYLRLWESLMVETRARSLFKRLKRLYSLLLQLLILGAIVLALTQPAFDLSSVKKESVVVLLDTSASMQAVEADERSRFEVMLERARELVENRSFEDEMMLAAVSDRVQVLCSFNRNTLRLRDALERVEVTHRSLDVDRAYAFAAAVSHGREHPLILFLSDGAGSAVRERIAKDPAAHLVRVGEARDNVGILRFSARKNASLSTDYLLARIKNFGDDVAEGVLLDLSLDGQTLKVRTRDIPPGAEVTERWEFELHEGGVLRLDVEYDDALALDNQAWAVVRPSRLRKVLLVTPSRAHALPFWTAFQSMGEVIHADSLAVTAEEYAALSEAERQADVTICSGALPDDLPAEGNLILMDTELPDFLPARQTGRDEDPTIWDWDREHLLNRYINYRDLDVPAARTIELDAGEALVESFAGALISAFDLSGRMVVYVGFDMTAQLFFFRLAFPMLLRNAIAWFEVEEDLVLEASYAPGDTIQPLRRVAGSSASATYFDDAGEPVDRELEVRGGRFWFSDTENPGTYLFRIAGVNHATAVNLFDAGESNIAPEGALDEDARFEVERGRHLFNRDLWALLAIAGVALWILEWALYHRRITE